MPDRPSHTSNYSRRQPGVLLATQGFGRQFLEGTIKEVNSPELLPIIASPLREMSAAALEWPRLREYIAGRTFSLSAAPGSLRSNPAPT
ncbi:hypothetical protein RBB78_05065 [Tunturiibacter empetritectus]|uniref:hypothetical protein n=1 Tax=Tunturiibacter empetritectus TaxID=3069691 RepID=UPI003D9B8D1F